LRKKIKIRSEAAGKYLILTYPRSTAGGGGGRGGGFPMFIPFNNSINKPHGEATDGIINQ